MPRKCCVFGCKSNYDSQEKNPITTYSFPTDPGESERWRKSLPNYVTITKYTAVCFYHWPANFDTISSYGHKRPKHPPSIFQNIPHSCIPTQQPKKRDLAEKKLSLSVRSAVPDEYEEFNNQDIIKSWEDLKKNIAQCDAVRNLNCFVQVDKDSIDLYYLCNKRIEVTVIIDSSFCAKVKHFNTSVDVRRLLGFQCHLERWSQIEPIVKQACSTDLSLSDEVKVMSKQIQDIMSEENTEENSKISFLLDNINLLLIQPNGRRYTVNEMLTASEFYFASRSAYCVLRRHLALPHPDTIKKCFGGLNNTGTKADCESIIASEMKTLSNDHKRQFMILFDEIHVQASLRFRGNHIYGYAEDDASQIARTMLTFMIRSATSGESFVCRLIPIHTLKVEFIVSQLNVIIDIMYRQNANVICCICDGHPTNVGAYNSLRGSTQPDSFPWKMASPLGDDDPIFLIFDPVHVFKNIRNNWITEKTMEMKFVDLESGESVIAKWRDMEAIHKKEALNYVKTTKLSYRALNPSTLDRQKVCLVLDVFHEKTCAALKLVGDDETFLYLNAMVNMWKVFNVKNATTYNRLNDPMRAPINKLDHPNLIFLSKLAESVKKMKGGRGAARCKSLTSETRNALIVTLTGIIEICGKLLSSDFKFVLLGKFQSDRLEGEFGVYRQLNGGCYHLSVDQILSSARFRRMQIYAKLVESGSDVITHKSDCCEKEFTEGELLALDDCVSEVTGNSEEERSALYYIAGYIAFKEDLSTIQDLPTAPASIFTDLVSRGCLSHPPEWLLMFCELCYTIYKTDGLCSCGTRLKKLFFHLHNTVYGKQHDNVNVNSITRRLVNIFLKGTVTQVNNVAPLHSEGTARKLRKLSSM